MANSSGNRSEDTGSNRSRAEMWGCIGTVTAAVVTGVFTLLASGTLSDFIERVTPAVVETPQVVTVEPQDGTQTGTGFGPQSGGTQIGGLQPGGSSAGATPTLEPVLPVEPELPEDDPLLDSPGASIQNDWAAPPVSYSCPFDARAGYLSVPGSWYGPYDGYYIAFDLANFYVYDPNAWDAFYQTWGSQIYYSSAPVNASRNVWQPLTNSPFWVCIDTAGYVLALYAP